MRKVFIKNFKVQILAGLVQNLGITDYPDVIFYHPLSLPRFFTKKCLCSSLSGDRKKNLNLVLKKDPFCVQLEIF